MGNYKGKRQGSRRVVIWARLTGDPKSRPHEWIIQGTKRDGDAFEAKKRIELNASRRVEIRVAPTFSDFCLEHYAPHAKAHLKASTWKVRRYHLAALESHFGDVQLSALTVGDVERYKSARQVQPAVCNLELKVFRAILSYARTLGVAVPALTWKRLPERGKGRVKCWTAGEVQALYAAARGTSLLPLLVFLINTGCRKGEALAAEWSWIDLEHGMVRIPSNRYWQPKSGRPREIPMSDAVRAVLSGPRKHSRWVFPHKYGGKYAIFPEVAYARARTEAGLTGGPHTTRHTFASHFLASGRSLQLLAEVMGHSSTKVTELYAHLVPGNLDEARNAVNIGPEITELPAPYDFSAKSTGRA